MTLNKMNGKGVFTAYSGNSYDGFFLEDMREGPGTFYSSDKSTSWHGIWQKNILTCDDAHLVVKRRDIFNKIPFKILPPPAEVSYAGAIVDGIVDGKGQITSYYLDESAKSHEIFSLKGHFSEGALNLEGSTYLEFALPLRSKMNNTSIQIAKWNSKWIYGSQIASGEFVLAPSSFGPFRFENGAIYHKNTGKYVEEEDPVWKDHPELYEVLAALETVRAFEWHFIFHRVILDPLTPFMDSSAISSGIETDESDIYALEKHEL